MFVPSIYALPSMAQRYCPLQGPNRAVWPTFAGRYALVAARCTGQTAQQAEEEGLLSDHVGDVAPEEEFHPRGTIAVVAIFVATLILLWLSIYLILIARGVTV